MVFQNFNLWAHMTVLENVIEAPMQVLKLSKAQAIEQAEKLLQKVGLIEKKNIYPAYLSGGQQQRVAIARAIVNKPKYLFCDEPNSGLDPKTAIVIDNLIKEITEEYDITTVINTHDMNSVMEIGERIIFLKEGILAWEGTKKDIFKTDLKKCCNQN